MHGDSHVYRFGPFALDAGRRRLSRDRDPVWLPDRQLDVLLILVANAGRIVSKDTLVDAAWQGMAVSDDSIFQVMTRLRTALGSRQDGEPYVETLVRKGYRFVAPVDRGEPPPSTVSIDALLEPYCAFVDGRAALETLDLEAIVGAREVFVEALRVNPAAPAAHIGMANACALAFESTRVDAEPDRAALAQADHHAREGCRLAPAQGDAWSTLAFVRHRHGDAREAVAAARKAVALEPHNWRHHVRLAFVSWGEERLRAAYQVLALCPGQALGHWFAATVFVAREAFDHALEELRAGCASQDAQCTDTGRFTAVGLHLLHGLVLAARGAVDEGLAEFERELAFEHARHVYGRECAANTWYAIGALRLRQRRPDDAHAAFHEALRRVPGHGLAIVGLATTSSGFPPVPERDETSTVEAATVYAAVLAREGKHQEAACLCGEALRQAAMGSAGWMLPVEPLLHVTAHRDVWVRTLAMLRDRAA